VPPWACTISLCSSASGTAAQLTATKECSARSLEACKARAKSSLPVPVAPISRIGTSREATRFAARMLRAIDASPRSSSSSALRLALANTAVDAEIVAYHVDATDLYETDAPDPVMALKARDIVHAMARGFSEDRAFRLLDEDAYLEILDIKDFAHSRNRVAQIRARLIGTRGKTRRIIEELTGVDVSVWGHTIALIGGTFEMVIARDAVIMLLRGSEHKTVYRFLERKRADLKAYQMGF